MPMVDFITYCCPKDIHKAYAGWDNMFNGHKYKFHEVMLIRQRCRGIDAGMELDHSIRVLETEDYSDEFIFGDFGIDPSNPIIHRVSPDPNRKFYWKWLCINQFIGLKVSKADYILFNDCDNILEHDSWDNSWVDRGLRALCDNREILMVCPNHRHTDDDEKTKIISQFCFLCERERFLGLDYNVPVPSDVEWGEFHFEFEGMLWRYVQKHNVYRLMLKSPPVNRHLAW